MHIILNKSGKISNNLEIEIFNIFFQFYELYLNPYHLSFWNDDPCSCLKLVFENPADLSKKIWNG